MKIAFILPLLFTATGLYAQTSTRPSGTDYAVFFAVADFERGWPALPQTLPEANALAAELEQTYGFQKPEVLAYPSKKAIKDKLTALATRKYQPADQLLLFFSMHGYFDESGDAGCLVPAGGLYNDPSFDTWLLHTELRALVSRIPCEHLLVALDACYSGTFSGNRAKPEEPPFNDCQSRVKEAQSQRTRLYRTAGGKEKVPANSEFARRWKLALTGRGGDDGVLTFPELYAQVSDAVPAPKWGDFSGHAGGGFVFVSKNSCASQKLTPIEQDQADWRAAKQAGTAKAYLDYLDKHPKGQGLYAEDAREAIERLSNSATPVQRDPASSAQPPISNVPAGTTRPDPCVLIKGGTFQMGNNDGSSDEKPVHSVTISDFYLSKYETTVAEFKAFIDDTGYRTDAEKEGDSYGYEGTEWKKIAGRNWRHDPEGNPAQANHPVISVSWNDATEYCKWWANKTGLPYRLPTEAEWEYAAGNGSRHTKYSWGDGDPAGRKGGNVSDETAKARFSGWTIFSGYTDGYVFTAPVGSFDANELGLHDMTGNVWEWCSDWYGSDYYKSSPAANPTGPSSGSLRVLRGGSWFLYPQFCRVAFRYGDAPGVRVSNVGFRLARTK